MADQENLQEEPQQPDEQSDDNTAAKILAVLLILISAKQIADAVSGLVKALLITPVQALVTLQSIGYKPVKQVLPAKVSTAADATKMANLRFKAAFVVNAAKRIKASDDLKAALKREKQLYGMHKNASSNRMDMAKRSDDLSELYGPILGWYAVRDSVTTPECAWLSGKNYEAAHPPGELHPGARHPRCRCFAGPPFWDAPVVRKLPPEFGTDLLE